jgi:L-alanine-DL-glutamate epimerase-like enolase superfamily enzyme
MRGYLDRGYNVVKMKIGGAPLAEDCKRIEAVLKIGRRLRLAVDANGRFDLETAIAYAKALREYDAVLVRGGRRSARLRSAGPLAENSIPARWRPARTCSRMQDARNLIRYGGMRPDRDWLQFDCALSYGLVEYLRTLDVLKKTAGRRRRCIPHGGHQMSLNIAAGLGLGGNESYPDLFQPYGGFPGWRARRERPHRHAGTAGHRLRGQVRPDQGDARSRGGGGCVETAFGVEFR